MGSGCTIFKENESYVLGDNITVYAGIAIDLLSNDNVTLDLNGYTVSLAPPVETTSADVCIRASGDNITVLNGFLQGGDTGIRYIPGPETVGFIRIEGVVTSGQGFGIQILQGDYGSPAYYVDEVASRSAVAVTADGAGYGVLRNGSFADCTAGVVSTASAAARFSHLAVDCTGFWGERGVQILSTWSPGQVLTGSVTGGTEYGARLVDVPGAHVGQTVVHGVQLDGLSARSGDAPTLRGIHASGSGQNGIHLKYADSATVAENATLENAGNGIRSEAFEGVFSMNRSKGNTGAGGNTYLLFHKNNTYLDDNVD